MSQRSTISTDLVVDRLRNGNLGAVGLAAAEASGDEGAMRDGVLAGDKHEVGDANAKATGTYGGRVVGVDDRDIVRRARDNVVLENILCNVKIEPPIELMARTRSQFLRRLMSELWASSITCFGEQGISPMDLTQEYSAPCVVFSHSSMSVPAHSGGTWACVSTSSRRHGVPQAWSSRRC